MLPPNEHVEMQITEGQKNRRTRFIYGKRGQGGNMPNPTHTCWDTCTYRLQSGSQLHGHEAYSEKKDTGIGLCINVAYHYVDFAQILP